jgi:hypothetical protein
MARDAHSRTFPMHRFHNRPGWWMENVIHSEFVARCTMCGQPVREDHSHVMIVPVGRGRMFFHAGCWQIKAVRDEGDHGLKAQREASSA